MLTGALLSAGHPLGGQVSGAGLEDGVAIVTSRKGDVSLVSADGKKRAAELHAIETLSGVEVTTGGDSYVFFSLSNGIGLGVHGSSRIRFAHYDQQPFPAEKESLDYEPTLSKLTAEVTEGCLVFAADHLSPLSEIIVKLPKGEVRVHRASGRVLYDEKGAQISISRGIVTYNYPHSTEQEFINAPNQVRISDESAMRGRVAESSVIDPASADGTTQHLVEAADHASERVIFRIFSEEASIPQPILVAKPESLQKPSPRPYRYLE